MDRNQQRIGLLQSGKSTAGAYPYPPSIILIDTIDNAMGKSILNLIILKPDISLSIHYHHGNDDHLNSKKRSTDQTHTLSNYITGHLSTNGEVNVVIWLFFNHMVNIKYLPGGIVGLLCPKIGTPAYHDVNFMPNPMFGIFGINSVLPNFNV